MTEAHDARRLRVDGDGHDEHAGGRRGVPAWWPLVWAAMCFAAFVTGWVLVVPRDPTGTLRLGPASPTAGIPAADLARIDLYGTWATPFEVATLVLPVGAVLFLGLTPWGTRLTARIAVGVRLQSLRALLIAFAVVGIAWLVTLPAQAAREVVHDAAGAVSGGWTAWTVRRLVQLVEWGALAGLAVLAVRLCSRLFRRSWWVVLTLVVFVLVLIGALTFGRLAIGESQYPSLPDGPLRSDVLALADETGVDVVDVRVVPQTPTTTQYNAYVTGVEGDHLVVLYEALLLRSTRAEIQVVVAHELGHVAASDSERRALLASLGAALMTALVGATATWPQVRRRVGTDSLRIADAPAVPMLIALTVAAGVIVVPLLDAASRALEVRADFTALEITDDPAALRAVVSRSAVLRLEQPDPPWIARILSGHPSPAQRVVLADAWAARSR